MTGMQNGVAGGNVTGARFIKQNTAVDNGVLQAGDNEASLGISQQGTRNAPGTAADDGYVAISGENVGYHTVGQRCLLEIGAAVTRGEELKPDSVGRGVKVATTGTTIQEIGAIALASGGAAGVKIPVLVIRGARRPALT